MDKQAEELIRLKNQLKAVHIPSKVVFKGITSKLIFNTYTIPSNIDDLTLKQVKDEIIRAKNAKINNEKYNKDTTNKHELQIKLADEQTRINALTSQYVLATKSTPLVIDGMFNDEIARLYGLKVTFKSNCIYSYTTSSNSITITVSQSSTIKTVAPRPIHITMELTEKERMEIEKFRRIYGENSITNDGNGVITIHDMGDKYLDVDFRRIKTMKSGFTIPQGVTTIGNDFLYSSTNMAENFTIPSSVTSIGRSFLYSSTNMAENFTIPSLVTSIGDNFLSFSTHMADNFTIPNSVTIIGNRFLYFSKNMADNFTIPNSVTSIGSAFLSHSTNIADNFTIPNSVTSIGGWFLHSLSNMHQPNPTSYNQIWNGNAWVKAPRSTPSSPLEDESILLTEDMIGIYRP